MMRALNTAGAGMVAQQMNLDVIANNLANVNTTAFKQQRAEFQDMMYQTFRSSGAATGSDSSVPQAAQIGLGARFTASASSFAQGSVITSGNPLDLSIQGDGFFQIVKDGQTLFTRDGSFKLDSNGQIVTSDGYPLEPSIQVPAGTTNITISPQGSVDGLLPGSATPQNLGNITLATFPNPAGLTRVGQNLYASGGGSGDATVVTPGSDGAGQVQAYSLEASNVQIVEEMVRMITAQRAYEINSKAIQTADDMLGVLNNLKR
jgi:flagellar basal-body rod protein FlgG